MLRRRLRSFAGPYHHTIFNEENQYVIGKAATQEHMDASELCRFELRPDVRSHQPETGLESCRESIANLERTQVRLISHCGYFGPCAPILPSRQAADKPAL